MIRFTPELNSEITRVVNKFNAKVSKLMSKNATHLPSLVDENILKSKYIDRKMLIRELKQLEDFTKPGAEEVITSSSGLRMTQWEWNKIEQDRVYALKNITRSLNKTKFSPDITNNLRSQQHFLKNQAVRSNLARSNKERNQVEQDLRTLRSITSGRLLKHVRDYDFKQNLLTMIERGFSEAGIDQETIQSIIDELNTLSPEDLSRAYHENVSLRNFIEGYNALKQYDFMFVKKEGGALEFQDGIKTMNEIGINFAENIHKIVEEIKDNVDTVNKKDNTTFYEF